jgi:hypothetical protein
MPDIPALSRACLRSAIYIYLTPWIWWLDYLAEDNTSLWDKRLHQQFDRWDSTR